MPMIQVTQADLMKTKTIESGWYGVEVVKVWPAKTSAAGDSVNYVLDFLVDGTGGKEIPVTFNTKLMGKIAPLIEAVMGKKFEAGNFDTDELLHKKCDGKVGSRLYEGNMINEITDFLPAGKGKGQVAPF